MTFDGKSHFEAEVQTVKDCVRIGIRDENGEGVKYYEKGKGLIYKNYSSGPISISKFRSEYAPSVRTLPRPFQNAPHQSPSPLAREDERVWKTVKTWRGSGQKQTESFAISASEWRVRWTSSDDAYPVPGILQLSIYDEKGQLISLAANVQGSSSDSSYVRSGPGRFYIKINSANLQWQVDVEQ